MKRLITIFVSSIVAFSLWGQNPKLPVTIVGDVYVDEPGKMLSEGPVHMRAITESVTDQKIARVANHGILTVNDSVIFYTNDSIEGLLMNQNPAANSVTSAKATVRKTIIQNNFWYMLSIPFDVDLTNGVTDALSGRKLVRGTDFQVQFYNSQKRADEGIAQTSDQNTGGIQIWENLDASATAMAKGIAYRIAVKKAGLTADPSGAVVVDFTSSAAVPDLFAKAEKTIPLVFTVCPPAKRFVDPENSQGWNAIGGANTTDFLFNSSTIGYSQTIYYRDNVVKADHTWDSSGWKDMLAEDANGGTLRPYGVIFVQTGSAGEAATGFKYLAASEGLVLDQGSPLFRSSQATTSAYDLFKLQLSNGKNDAVSKMYFKLNDSYSKVFTSSEGDNVKMGTLTSTTEPVVWALVKNSNDYDIVTFVDALPYDDNEVTLGVNIPTAGEYAFSLKDVAVKKGIESAILWDKTENTKTELLKTDYNFQAANASNTTDRFVLFINKSMTSIDQVATSEIYAYAENNTIIVKNLGEGDKVQILDLTGRIIASGVASSNTYSATVSQKGVYIVNARNGGKILKVLNK